MDMLYNLTERLKRLQYKYEKASNNIAFNDCFTGKR